MNKGLKRLIERDYMFLASSREYNQSRAVILGAPMDYTVSFRPGSRMAPGEIRKMSLGLEEYSVAARKDLRVVSFFDAGDLLLPFGGVQESLNIIEEALNIIFAEGKIPFLLGGEHLVTLPAVKAAEKNHPGLVLLHFDAHADLREGYMGQTYSHASVLNRIIKETEIEDIYQFGIRSGTKEEMELAEKKTNFSPQQDMISYLKEILIDLKGRPLYITLDIDVVDPAYAPGTGTPEPGGVTSREILQAINLLRGQNIVGFDLVEVCPPYDPAGITSILAAKLIREALLHFS